MKIEINSDTKTIEIPQRYTLVSEMIEILKNYPEYTFVQPDVFYIKDPTKKYE